MWLEKITVETARITFDLDPIIIPPTVTLNSIGMRSHKRKQEFSMKCVLMEMMETEIHKQGITARDEHRRRMNPQRKKADHAQAAAGVIATMNEGPQQPPAKKVMIAFDASPQRTEPARKMRRIRKVVRSDVSVGGLAERASMNDSYVRVSDESDAKLRSRKVRLT
jgi:hypothetical protein